MAALTSADRSLLPLLPPFNSELTKNSSGLEVALQGRHATAGGSGESAIKIKAENLKEYQKLFIAPTHMVECRTTIIFLYNLIKKITIILRLLR